MKIRTNTEIKMFVYYRKCVVLHISGYTPNRTSGIANHYFAFLNHQRRFLGRPLIQWARSGSAGGEHRCMRRLQQSVDCGTSMIPVFWGEWTVSTLNLATWSSLLDVFVVFRSILTPKMWQKLSFQVFFMPAVPVIQKIINYILCIMFLSPQFAPGTTVESKSLA